MLILSGLLAQPSQARSRSGQSASTSSSSSNGWTSSGSRSSYYTVYNVDGVEFIVEEGTEDDHAGTEGFWAWHQSGSWQSSWQANRKQQQRKQAQQQQEQQSRRKQQQRRQPKSEREELMDVLAQLDADTIAGLQQVFGPRLQDLQSKEVS